MNIAIRHIVAILLIGMLGQVSYSRDAAVVYSEAVSSVYTLRVLYDDGSTSTGSGLIDILYKGTTHNTIKRKALGATDIKMPPHLDSLKETESLLKKLTQTQ